MPSVTKFKDLSISFTRNKITNDLLVKKEDAAVKQAVVNILMTNKGERLFDPEYGSNVPSYLFDQLDYGTAANISDAIRECLSKYEPRISIISLGVEPDFDQNGFEVQLAFKVIGRDDLAPFDVEFFLSRTR
tara:strand:+ start:2118 stop:2513 length:396 start_codon:yes stop_codon:yes gene_type:complete